MVKVFALLCGLCNFVLSLGSIYGIARQNPNKKQLLCKIIFYPYIKYISLKAQKNSHDPIVLLVESAGVGAIKMGQFFAMRPDLIGYDMAGRLATLWSKVVPMSHVEARDIIANSLGSKMLEIKSIDYDNFYSASVGQVYCASLVNGEKVAIKVIKPFIRSQIANAARILSIVASIASIFMKLEHLRIKDTVKEFKARIEGELLMNFEAAKMDEFRTKVGPFLSHVYIPKIYWHLTSENVLIAEWIDGAKIREVLPQLSMDVKINLAENIVLNFLQQVYHIGIFHGDPHFDNMLLMPDGRLALLDFGAVGYLTFLDKLHLTAILHGFLEGDYDLIAKIHQKAGYINGDIDLRQFTLSCRIIGSKFVGKDVSSFKASEMLMEFFKAIERFGIKNQPQLLIFHRAILIMEGMVAQLNPIINIWEISRPIIKKWANKNITPEAMLARKMKNIIGKFTSFNDIY